MTAYKKRYLNIKKEEYIYIIFYENMEAAGKIVFQCMDPYKIKSIIEKLKSENGTGEYIHVYGEDLFS